MNTSILNIFLGLLIIGSYQKTEATTIVDYEPAHKEAIVTIALQDPEILFLGHSLVTYWLRLYTYFFRSSLCLKKIFD